MTEIRGNFGPITVAKETIVPGSVRKGPQRPPNDPINFIKIDCKIPKENKYSVGSTDVFDFGEEMKRLNITKYTEILKL